MNAILDKDFGRSRAYVSEAEAQTTESTPARNDRTDDSESGFVAVPSQRDFGHTLSQTSGNGRRLEPAGFTAFIDRFDGLRIPSSPLHEF